DRDGGAVAGAGGPQRLHAAPAGDVGGLGLTAERRAVVADPSGVLVPVGQRREQPVTGVGEVGDRVRRRGRDEHAALKRLEDQRGVLLLDVVVCRTSHLFPLSYGTWKGAPDRGQTGWRA